MLTRFRWYRVKPGNQNSDLEDLIVKTTFTPTTPFGFIKLNPEFDENKFRFLWRTKIVVTKINDDGTPTYEQIASINFTDFAIIKVSNDVFLRIENPGRNIRELLNSLESIIGLGFTSRLITFEKIKPTTIFKKIEHQKLIGLKIIGSVPDNDVIARMEFASKEGMKFEEMKLLDNLNYKIDYCMYELIFEGLRGQLAISSNGLIKISGQLTSKLVHLIEQDLPSIIN